MIKLWAWLKELIMKATRFIFNTDYATHQNDAEFTLSITLPASFSVSAGQVKKYTATKTVKGSASKDYRCYFNTSINNYGITGVLEVEIQYGSDILYGAIERQKDKWTLNVHNLATVSSHTYSGQARVVTAHIMTFVDPFQL